VQSVSSKQDEHSPAGVGAESAATMKGATLAVTSAATALVLIVFTVPLTTSPAPLKHSAPMRAPRPGS
jgi:hypothetical protein